MERNLRRARNLLVLLSCLAIVVPAFAANDSARVLKITLLGTGDPDDAGMAADLKRLVEKQNPPGVFTRLLRMVEIANPVPGAFRTGKAAGVGAPGRPRPPRRSRRR